MNLAPIVLFTYKRLHTLQRTVQCLQENFLAVDSDLYIFSDAAKEKKDAAAVGEVRKFIKSIDGFRAITIIEAPNNKGLANSIIQGVSKILDTHDRVIVLEDDLITSKNFLSFMNDALVFYKGKNVFSVAGFSFPVKGLPQDTVYFTRRASSWGWATWKDQWENIDWDVKDYKQLENDRRSRRRFNQMGSDLSAMLRKQMRGEIDSWAIRWCYHQFKMGTFTVHPVLSKVKNAGFDAGATHTKDRFERYSTTLDDSNNTKFVFTDHVAVNPQVLEQAIKYYSIPYRIYYNILNMYYRLLNSALRRN